MLRDEFMDYAGDISYELKSIGVEDEYINNIEMINTLNTPLLSIYCC